MSKVYGPPRTDFGPPPPGYIPGVGRGALAFTTRSDVGPATRSGDILPERGQGPAELQRLREARERELREENQYDEFSGYGGSLFGSLAYTADDDKADMVWEAIEERMESRYAKLRKQREEKNAEKKNAGDNPVKQELSALKKELDSVSAEEWANLPAPLDLSGQNRLAKKERIESYKTQVPIADSLLIGRYNAAGHVGMLDPNAAPLPPPGAGVETDLTSISQARDRALGMRLDSARESGTQTSLGSLSVDAQGYLTDLSSLRAGSGEQSGFATGYTTGMGGVQSGPAPQISDAKKFRLLFKSAIASNPTSAPAWIGAARLERDCGRMNAARELLKRACEHCATNEDVWLEAVEMAASLQDARAILAQAVRHIPKSSRIWLRAAEIEKTPDLKRAVLRRGLESMPTSEVLWRAAIQLEQPDDARILLSRAVELIPTSVDFWLALARLEPYQHARQVLNLARQKIPNDPQIWLAAAKLEEGHRLENLPPSDVPRRCNDPPSDIVSLLERMMNNAIKSLEAHGASLPRQFWFDEAAKAEREGAHCTASALIRAALGIGIDPVDRADTWKNDITELSGMKLLTCARAAASKLLEEFTDRPTFWLLALKLEREFNKTLPENDVDQKRAARAAEESLLEKAVTACPTDEGLWLTYAKALWVKGDPDAARNVLSRAFIPCAGSVEVWIAAAKLEQEEGEFTRCHALLKQARTSLLEQKEQGRGQGARAIARGRIWIKSAKLSRLLYRWDEMQELLEEGIKLAPNFTKLWLMQAQMHEAKAARIIIARRGGTTPGSIDGLRNDPYYARLLLVPGAVPAWIASEYDAQLRTRLQLKCEAQKTEGTVTGSTVAQSIQLQPSPLESKQDSNADAMSSGSSGTPGEEDELLTAARAAYTAEWAASKAMSVQEADAAIATAVEKARDAYRRAVREHPKASVQLWLSFARCELRFGRLQARARTRAVLERARASLPESDELWTESIRLELLPEASLVPAVGEVTQQPPVAGAITPAAALVVAATAQKNCPNSGRLMGLAIEAPERPQARKSLCTHALDRLPDDPYVLLAVAKVFWDARKINTARTWFTRATTASPALGDTWIYFYKMELECGTQETQDEVVRMCTESNPRYGELWNAVAKQERLKPLPPAEVLYQAALQTKGIFATAQVL